jgi:hypothetical protein
MAAFGSVLDPDHMTMLHLSPVPLLAGESA